MFQSIKLIAAVVLISLVVGCRQNVYELELKPAGKKIDRQLLYWTAGNQPTDENGKNLADAEALRIAESSYDKKMVVEDGKFKFQKSFGSETPQDIGGFGRYQTWESSMGSASVYVERFRGSTDFAEQLNGRRIATDKFTDVVIGWLKEELGDLESFAQLRSHFDGQVRSDLQNLSILSWQLGFDSHQSDFTVRLGLFLVEREYLDLGDITAFSQVSENDARPLLVKRLGKLIKSHLDEKEVSANPGKLKFLETQKNLNTSWETHLSRLSKSGELARIIKELNLDVSEPKPDQFVNEVVTAAFLPNIQILGGDELEAKLHLPSEPAITNGKWDPEDQAVTWGCKIGNREDKNIPDLLYAGWATPDVGNQTRYFGDAILTEWDLVGYLFWFEGLPPLERTKWNKFLEQLRPGPSLVNQLKAFKKRESGNPVAKIAEILLSGITKAKSAKTDSAQ